MPIKSDLTTTQLTSYLIETYGNNINSSQVRDAGEFFGVSYATVTKRLREFYVRRNTWNLTVQEKLEEVYQAPAAINVTVREQQNLIPDKDANFVPFGNFSDLKKVIQSKYPESLFY